MRMPQSAPPTRAVPCRALPLLQGLRQGLGRFPLSDPVHRHIEKVMRVYEQVSE